MNDCRTNFTLCENSKVKYKKKQNNNLWIEFHTYGFALSPFNSYKYWLILWFAGMSRINDLLTDYKIGHRYLSFQNLNFVKSNKIENTFIKSPPNSLSFRAYKFVKLFERLIIQNSFCQYPWNLTFKLFWIFWLVFYFCYNLAIAFF